MLGQCQVSQIFSDLSALSFFLRSRNVCLAWNCISSLSVEVGKSICWFRPGQTGFDILLPMCAVFYLVPRSCDCRLREGREEVKRAEARVLARRWSVRRRCHQNLLHTGVSMRRADGDTMSVISITSVSAASVCTSSNSGLSLMAETMSGIKRRPSFSYYALHLLLVLLLILGSVS